MSKITGLKKIRQFCFSRSIKKNKATCSLFLATANFVTILFSINTNSLKTVGQEIVGKSVYLANSRV